MITEKRFKRLARHPDELTFSARYRDRQGHGSIALNHKSLVTFLAIVDEWIERDLEEYDRLVAERVLSPETFSFEYSVSLDGGKNEHVVSRDMLDQLMERLS